MVRYSGRSEVDPVLGLTQGDVRSWLEGLREPCAVSDFLPFGLAGYVFSNSIKTATLAAEALEVGMVGVNDMMLASAEAPFGGVKESGMGREGGALGLRDYMEAKYIKLKL